MSYTQAFVSVLRYLRKVRPDEIGRIMLLGIVPA